MVGFFFSLFLYVSLGPPGTFGIPARAKITMKRAVLRSGYPDLPGGCINRRITTRELRHYFATYHELGELERKEGYQDLGCDIEGDIFVDGKQFHFTEGAIDLLDTTWPDGKHHSLGRDHSDLDDVARPATVPG